MLAELGAGAELCPLLSDHAAELADCVADSREHLARWTVVASRVVDEQSARQLLESYTHPPRYFGIRHAGALVGGALYRTLDVHDRICEVGGWLIPTAQGRGLITKAFRHMIEWAIAEYGMQRIELRASPENHAALAIARRLGMTHDATLRAAVALNGIRHDSEVWSILATEWPTGSIPLNVPPTASPAGTAVSGIALPDTAKHHIPALKEGRRMARNPKRERRSKLSAEDEALLARALRARAGLASGPICGVKLSPFTMTPAEIRAWAEQRRETTGLTTIALVTIDADGQVPDDAALTICGISVRLPTHRTLPSGSTSMSSRTRIATAVDELGYQLADDQPPWTLRSTDMFAFLVSRKTSVKLRVVADTTT